MYLEKLEIQGFKSFANKNKLIFSGLIGEEKRGLTAIVGPNGSGKSNVADAIRWALGEQSLKTLRGKKSEDVIFSGSDQKNQLSLAEVSLYLNNSKAQKIKGPEPEIIDDDSDLDQLIASCPEIIITRKLYRSGESEYLINNNRARLNDIQMLLAKANFGQKTYSVIGQGMVENFLSSSAAERKDFFDEATGVKQFQIKRDAALNKLEGSYENLQQVDLLLAEIKPRLKSLTRQVEKLKHRGEIELELKSDQLNYYGFLWQDISKKLESFNTRLLKNEKLKIEQEKKLNKLNEELNRIRATDNFQEINELQPRLKQLENERNQLTKQLNKLQAELEIQLETQGKFDISWLSNKQGELNLELKNLNVELSSLAKNQKSSELRSQENELQLINQKLQQAQQKTQEIDNLEEEQEKYVKQLSRLEAILEANLEIQGQFDVSWLNNKNEELQVELEKTAQEIENLHRAASQQEKNNLENSLQSIQSRLNSLNQEIEKINRELRSANSTTNKSQEISQIIDKFLKKLENISQESDLKRIKSLIIEAKDEFQAQIEKIINSDNRDKLENIKVIQEEIISLTEEKQKNSDQLNLENLRLNTTNERLRLLGEKQQQTTRELTEIRAKLAKAQIKFESGKIKQEKMEIGEKISALEIKIKKLADALDLEELQKDKQSILEKIQNCRLQISAHQERERLLEIQKIQTIKEISDIDNKLAKSQTKFDDEKVEEEKQEINQKLSLIEKDIKILENKLEELNQLKEKEKAQMFDCQKNIQTIQQELNIISSELSSQQVEIARQETKLEDLEANIKNDELNTIDIRNYEIKELTIDLEKLQKRLQINKSQLEQIGGIDPEAEKEYQETKERYDFLSNQTSDLNRAIKSLEEIIYELDLNIKNRFDGEFRLISEKFNDYFKILFSGGSAKIFKILTEDLNKEETQNKPGSNSELAAINTNNGFNSAEIEIKNEIDEKLKRIKFLKKHNAVDLAGIDIQATPPGKRIQTVTMLSGGERALTAIALICAIISANPSPFVVLDEVDAALDEANSERLAKILDDLSNKTQFIVITHNRACMRKASILYGVTMESDGVSKLLSVKLDEIKKQ
ncbi:MAG: AAA family ATPase [Patescibacteria group bacterium]